MGMWPVLARHRLGIADRIHLGIGWGLYRVGRAMLTCFVRIL